MDKKILGILSVVLVIGLVLGFFGGKSSSNKKINELNTQVNKLTGQAVAVENLKNQFTELKAQLDKVNVNNLYGLVKIGNNARAYKIGDMNKMPPLVVNDFIGNTPVVVSWCPLCDTITVYKREVDGKILTFTEAGARKIPGTEIENLHFKDSETGSLWAQGPGIAVEGPKKGAELQSIPIQLFNKDRIDKMGVDVWKP